MADKGTWNFARLLAMLDGVTDDGDEGEFAAELSEEMQMLIEALHKRAVAGAKTVKGTLSITLDVKVASNGMLNIEPNVQGKLPRKTRKDTPFWLGKHGLTQENPRQQKLPLREVGGGTRDIREPGERAEGGE